MSDDAHYRAALERLEQLLERAAGTALREPAAMTLATVGANGRPSARIVLLRGFDERGFRFFTNTLSRKGRELAEHPFAALCLYWDELAEQVRVEGRVERLPADEVDAYWSTRPRESRVGAWASAQSEPLPDRETLERRFAEFGARFGDADIPRPDHWSGYLMVPDRIEFWQSRPARLHERTVYEKTEDGWTMGLLAP